VNDDARYSKRRMVRARVMLKGGSKTWVGPTATFPALGVNSLFSLTMSSQHTAIERETQASLQPQRTTRIAGGTLDVIDESKGNCDRYGAVRIGLARSGARR